MDKNDKDKKEEIEIVPDEEEENRDLHKKIKPLKDELKKCEAERKEYLEGWQRAKADYINYKNEEGKRLEDLGRFITTGLILDILPVLDSFDLALGHSLPPEIERGVLLIKAQLEDIFKKRGLQEITTAPGDKFNPEVHESIGEVESDKESGSIAEEVQKGYKLRDRIIRASKVRLAKPKT